MIEGKLLGQNIEGWNRSKIFLTVVNAQHEKNSDKQYYVIASGLLNLLVFNVGSKSDLRMFAATQNKIGYFAVLTSLWAGLKFKQSKLRKA